MKITLLSKNKISSKNKKIRAQTSMEFVILTGFMIMAFLIFYIMIQSKLVEANRDATDQAAKQIEKLVVNEITIAESVIDGYYREFELPQRINGINYDVEILSGVGDTPEIVVSYGGKERVYFLEQSYIDETSTAGKGWNNISKVDGVILIKHKN